MPGGQERLGLQHVEALVLHAFSTKRRDALKRGGDRALLNHRLDDVELNIDPISAARIWETQIPLVICPLDITNNVPITPEFIMALSRRRHNPIADLAGLPRVAGGRRA